MYTQIRFARSCIAAAALLGVVAATQAAVTAEEARQLGSTLTPVGAQKAGNADKSIPDYTGGLTTAPASYKKGSGIRPDPFESEKPLYTITGKNLAEYESRLTAATQELLRRHSGFRVDVYRSHRTAALPKFVLDNTLKNATATRTTADGLGVENMLGGVPFPIPKNGTEVLWNHLLRYNGGTIQYKFDAYNVDSSGKATLATIGESIEEQTVFDPKRTTPLGANEPFGRVRQNWIGPPRRAGEALMVFDSPHSVEQSRRAWIYLPGQRRVKLAPEVGHDTPNPGTAGMTTYDDAKVFNGSAERFDVKLVGKRELIIPYNAYKLTYATNVKDLLTPGFLNPDYVRWELHRVWVVEATLKPGKRHVYSKRIFYIDEDSWAGVASDQYDARGQLYRATFDFITPAYEVPAVPPAMSMTYDFVQQSYAMLTIGSANYFGYRYIDPLSATEWSPDALAGSGVR